MLDIIINKHKERDYYTKSELKEIGFTESMINKLLPKPILKTNPIYKSAAPMKLWLRTDIHNIMETEEYKKEKSKAEKRQKSTQKAVETKTSKLRKEINEEISKIQVKLFSGNDDNLRKIVIKEKEYWYSSYDYYCSIDNVDENTINRWVVNYIRHNLTRYDNTLYEAKGKTGITELYPEYKNAVLAKIAEVYPKYAEECNRQMYKNVVTKI